MKPVNRFLYFLIIVLLGTVPVFAQQGGPGAKWTGAINFGANSGAEDAWAFSAAELPNGDIIAVGYVTKNDVRMPGYAVLDKNGKLIRSKIYDNPGPGGGNAAGGFGRVIALSGGGCVLVGYQNYNPGGEQAFVVRLNTSYNEVWTSHFDVANSPSIRDRIYTVLEEPSGSIILAGGLRGGIPFIIRLDGATGNIAAKLAETYFSGFNGQINDSKIITQKLGFPPFEKHYLIFTGFKTHNEKDWQFEITEDPDCQNNSTPNQTRNSENVDLKGNKYLIRDDDVFYGRIDLDGSLDIVLDEHTYNSKEFCYSVYGVGNDAKAASNPATPGLWQDPTCNGQPSNQYGPCTPGFSVSGWDFPDGSGSPAADHFLANNSTDQGTSIMYDEVTQQVYIVAELNTFQITSVGFGNGGLQHNGDGVLLKNYCDPGEDKEFHDYKDGYVFVMKLDLDGTLLGSANVAHFSGGDFTGSGVMDVTDGNIVIGGNTADRNICGLPALPTDCEFDEANMIIKVDADNLNTLWQQTYLGYGNGNCTFGIIQLADGGFLLIGNNEVDHEETFNIVRFTNDCEAQAGVSYDLDQEVYKIPQVPQPNSPNVEIWDAANTASPHYVRGQIVIPSGKVLVIDGITVRFAASTYSPLKSGILVQKGGRLSLINGALLSGVEVCNRGMWDGVVIESNPLPAAFTERGTMVMTGGSKIENALRGVVVGSAGWRNVSGETLNSGATGNTSTATYDDDQGGGGGWLYTYNAVFSNCAKGIVYNAKSFYSSLPTLNNTAFEFLGELADPNYVASGETPGKPIGSEIGVQMRGVQDVKFSNVRFINTGSDNLYTSWQNKPSGIYAIDSRIHITSSGSTADFENLYVGVESALTNTDAKAPSYISANFNKVYQGANLRALLAPVVDGSRFDAIPDVLDLDSDKSPWGVNAASSLGVLLSESDFTSNAGFDSYGAIFKNTLGTGGAEMRFNKFTDFNRANQFELDNAAMITKCNDYLGGVGDVSWRVKGEFANQGTTDDKPDNGFFTDCSIFFLDIENTGNTSFSYEERNQANPGVLLCWDGVNVNYAQSTELRNCTIIEDPCPMQPCTTLTEKYLQTGKLLQYRNQLLHSYARWEGGVNQDSSNLVSTDATIALLLDRNQQEDKRLLVGTYTALGNYSEAQIWLQQVSGTDAETADFIQYYTLLINAGQAGRAAHQLLPSEFQQIAGLMEHNTTISENVKVLDHVLNQRYHPLEVDLSEGGERSQQLQSKKDLTTTILLVYPNPFSGEVQFLAPPNTRINRLIITDISGKVLLEQNQAGEALHWQCDSRQNSIFLYTCTLSNGETLHGKLMHTANE